MQNINKEHITRGEAKVITLGLSDYKQVCIGSEGSNYVLLHMYLPDHKITPEIEANAEFIKDCFNVLNESGKTARELLEREAKLEDALTHCRNVFYSLFERGKYPEELMHVQELFMGKEGVHWITELLNK